MIIWVILIIIDFCPLFSLPSIVMRAFLKGGWEGWGLGKDYENISMGGWVPR